MICTPEAVMLLAQVNGDATATGITHFLVSWGPLLIFASIVIYFYLGLYRQNKSSESSVLEYTERMESKTDEMIELLRSINNKLDRQGQ